MGARKFLVPIDLTKLELQNPTLHILASAPSSPAKGQFYFNDTDKKGYYWNGTAWVEMGGGGGGVSYGTVVSETSFGQATANGALTTVSRSDHSHGTPTHVAADHSTIPLSTFAVPTTAVSFNNQRITSLADPTAATDAANKQYVDNLAAGISWKNSVRVATTVNITLSGTQTIDGVSVIANDRVLVKNQSTASGNGIYLCAAGAWTRTTDADTAAEIEGAAVFVEEGTAQADTAWVCTTNAPITVGTTSLTFVQFAGPGDVTAGTGMTQSGNTLNVIGGTGMVANADDIAVLRTDTNGRVPLLYTALVGDGSSVAITVTHNLNTYNSVVQTFQQSDGAQVECDVVHNGVNTVVLNFAVAPTASAIRVMVHA